jgi:hypothetical protein
MGARSHFEPSLNDDEDAMRLVALLYDNSTGFDVPADTELRQPIDLGIAELRKHRCGLFLNFGQGAYFLFRSS